MAQNSTIDWTDDTFNPWWGCAQISPACDHCYAKEYAKWRGRGKVEWGPTGVRRLFDDQHWKDPIRWNKLAQISRVRRRVFCGSMCDVFESRADLDLHRERLWHLIETTPWLDWLLLTKRPKAALHMVPWRGTWQDNVWFGATVENEHCLRQRVPYLIQSGALVRFVSCEPLLGPIELAPYLGSGPNQVNWVIAGGESGADSRPTDPSWIRSLRDQCTKTNTPFFFKQWGNWRPCLNSNASRRLPVTDGFVERMDKKSAGRLLDGRTWDEVPRVMI
jgi:protein gp37